MSDGDEMMVHVLSSAAWTRDRGGPIKLITVPGRAAKPASVRNLVKFTNSGNEF